MDSPILGCICSMSWHNIFPSNNHQYFFSVLHRIDINLSRETPDQAQAPTRAGETKGVYRQLDLRQITLSTSVYG